MVAIVPTLPIINPIRIYRINGQYCKVHNAPKELTVGNDRLLVAAVTGYVHRIMGVSGCANGGAATAGSFHVKDGAGTLLIASLVVPPFAAGGNVILPFIESGYEEGAVSQGLYADVGTQDVSINLQWISYIP